ncbi:uncharacterized protein LOC106163518 [Lingula anatina]|uniref:glucan endo-1,3-beta-D-glucosidase n=1 Tax=Lingula anatina TaxID=7574 RepID=A0A2R2MRM6_LINAN|nr:uncharacterized protein LOC106163518 [Lingula anatina]|eukprot:XP_023932662.1 uncharacterized protein LOC106163518 [Lingula anatina]
MAVKMGNLRFTAGCAVLLSLLVTTEALTQDKLDSICSLGPSDQYYFAHPLSCKRFIQCDTSRRGFEMPCAPDNCWNQAILSQDHCSNVDCNHVADASLPPGCTPLNDQPYSTTDPSKTWGTNTELQGLVPPSKRWGSHRATGALPTHHFAINQLKKGMSPIRQMPYAIVMGADGIVYDSYATLDRWNKSSRTDQMQEQTLSEQGKPWNKVTSMGTNVKQLVAGPDGNPTAIFDGKSGLKVSIAGSSDPTLEDFGELYANFLFSGTGGGKMEVPIVRGSPLMTHRITNANPNIRAFCLYSVNGQQVPIRPPCPTEPSAADGGEGFLEGTCDRGELVILLHSTKPLDVSLVQWAGAPSSQWPRSHNMHNCMSSTCSLANGNRTVTIRTGLSNGAFSFAVNVIYHYVLPNDWINHPELKTCRSLATSTNRRRRDTSNTLPSSTKFVLEVDEPRGRIKKQTRKFVLYFSTAMTPKVETNGDLTFSPHTGGKFTGIMQLAYSGVSPRGNLAVADFLDRYANTYAYKPETKYCVKGDKGYISFDWNKQIVKGISGSGQLLMVVMPHHEQLLKGQGGFITGTPYGFKALAADSWLQELDLPDGSMEPDMTAVQKIKQNAQQHQDIMKALDSDVRQQPLTPVCKASNSYGAGKAIGAAARLASISRAFGTTHYKSLDVQIEECLELWLRIKDGLANSNKLHYDTVWGGLMVRGVPDGQPINLGADFGFPTYNDHHFHLGYFMYALGYYTKYYPSWAKANRERILFLARDVGNPSYRDTHFPIVRHKDTFMGFSWATGVGPGTRQEESASEAINCYHGLAALGFGTKMASVEQMGRLMLAQEIASVREYWQVRPHNLHHFPPTLQTYGVVGQIGEGSFYLYTLDWACDPNWFPMRHACLVGIQSIPITAVSKYWMDKDWAVSVSKVCGWALNPTSAPGSNLVDKSKLTPVVKGWAAFCHAATSHASASAQVAAANYVKSVPFNQLVPGTTTSGTLLFIYGST